MSSVVVALGAAILNMAKSCTPYISLVCLLLHLIYYGSSVNLPVIGDGDGVVGVYCTSSACSCCCQLLLVRNKKSLYSLMDRCDLCEWWVQLVALPSVPATSELAC